MNVNAYGRYFRKTYRNPQEPVAPRRQVTGKGTDILMTIRSEGTRYRFQIEHFAHDTHDEEHNQTCQCIAEQYGRTGSLNRAGRAHEQADANRTAQGDHFHVAGF